MGGTGRARAGGLGGEVSDVALGVSEAVDGLGPDPQHSSEKELADGGVRTPLVRKPVNLSWLLKP